MTAKEILHKQDYITNEGGFKMWDEEEALKAMEEYKSLSNPSPKKEVVITMQLEENVCPNCNDGSIQEGDKYCNECGVKINWK